MVDAWSRLAGKYPEWTVKIYGSGPHRRHLDKRIRALGLEGAVQMMGQASDLKRAYQEAEIFCHPALFEGFGLAVAEALAQGLPVVAFADTAGVREMVRDGENGVLVPRRRGANALADGLEKLIRDRELRERAGW